MIENEFISTIEAAQILGVSRVTVFNMVKDGRLKAKKVGRNYIIRRRDLGDIFKNLSSKEKQKTSSAVKRVVHDYSETLKLLGNE